MRGVSSRLALVSALASLCALAGCAETQLANVAVKEVAASPQPATPGGTYKIGDAYQIDGVWYYPKEDYKYDETGVASWYGPNFHGKYTADGEIYDQNDVTAAHRTLPLPSIVRVTNLDNGRSLIVRINDRGPFAHGRIIDLSRRSAQLLGFENAGTAKVRVQIMAEESIALKSQMQQLASSQPPKATAVPRPSVVTQNVPPAVVGRPLPPPVAVATATPPAPPPTLHMVPTGAELAHQQVQMVPVKGSKQMYIQAGAFSVDSNARQVSAKLAGIAKTTVTPVKVAQGTMYRVRIGPISTVDQADTLLEKVIHSGYPEARLVVD